jgi:hypothetical protein
MTIWCWQTSNFSDRWSIQQWKDWCFRLNLHWFVNITLWLFTDLDFHISSILSHHAFVSFPSIAVVTHRSLPIIGDCEWIKMILGEIERTESLQNTLDQDQASFEKKAFIINSRRMWS